MMKFTMTMIAVAIAGNAGQALAQTGALPGFVPTRGNSNEKEIGNRIGVDMLFHSPERASSTYKTSLIAANCIVRLNADRAGSMIGGELTKDPQFKALRSGVDGGRYRSCLRDGSDSTVPMLLSAAIAEKLVLTDGAAAYDDRAKTVNIDEAQKFYGDLESGPVTMAKLTRCMVVYSPGLAKKVLLTEPGSTGELSALDALYAATPECAMRSRPADIPSAFQRGGLAQGLYAWSHQGK